MPKLTKSEYSPKEVRQELANLLQEKIDSYGSQLRKLREREVGRTALAKGDLCLLCAQLPVKCTCMSLRKASVEQVNGEMKGFKSVASSPTFGGGKLTNPPKTAPRPGNGNRAASGMIPNAKAEPAPKAKKFRIPRKGGKLKKHTAAMPSADPRPTPSGVPGKQPVGQGGGDAFKVPHPATTASLNDVRQMAPAAANATKDKASLPAAKAPMKSAGAAMPKAGMHPDTQASLAGVKALAPNAAWKSKALPALKAKLQNVQAAHVLAPHKVAPVATPAAAPAIPRPGAAQQLAADKRAGGVGFLNNLLSRFRRAPAAAMPTPGMEPAGVRGGPVQSQRFHGALPLRRSEPGPKVKPPLAKKGLAYKRPAFALGNCAMCSKAEHMGLCKEEMPAPTEGLSANHNRNMLRVSRPKARRSTSKLHALERDKR